MPRISAVLPCYNAGPYLAQAVESVRAQHRAVDEIIVVDDCSTDDSVAVARHLGVTVVRLERNAGAAAARNVGLRAASGEYIAWLDADDFWQPDHVARVAALLDEHASAAVAFGLVREFGSRSDTWPALIPEGAPVDAWAASFRRCLLPHNAVIVRRAVVVEVGGYDETLRLAEDYDLWMRLAWRHPFVCTHAVTAMWRRHESSTSGDPIRYWQGEYAARGRFVAALASGAVPPRNWGSRDSLADVRAAALSLWERDLSNSWHSRAPAYLRFHLSMADQVPESARALRRWRWKQWLLWAAMARDRLRRAGGETPPGVGTR